MTRNQRRKQRERLNRLRSDFYGQPWAIMPHTLGLLGDAIESSDVEAVQDLLSLGGNDDQTKTQVVDGVAIIPITGVLRDGVDFMVKWGGASSYQLIEKELKAHLANDQVKAILLFCDSPGGSAVGVKRLADMIAASRGTKPIHAYAQGVCGSAMYYIASATDKIVATADSLIGSIGTIFPQQEMSGYLKEMGVSVTVFTNSDSPKKSHGNMYEPLSDEARTTLQEFVNSYGTAFISDVASYRGIHPSDVVSKFGQGDAMRADIAIKNGMVDKIVPDLSSAIQDIRQSIGSRSPGSMNQTPVIVESQTPAQPISAQTGIQSESNSPVVTGIHFNKEFEMKVSQKVRAQLFALDLIDSVDVSDEICTAAMKAWFRGDVPQDEAAVLSGLRAESQPKAEAPAPAPQETKAADNVQAAFDKERSEARMAELRAAAKLVNAVKQNAVTGDMILDACEAKLSPSEAMSIWSEKLAAEEPAAPTNKVNVTGEGSDRYATDIVDALVYRSMDNPSMELSEGASSLMNRPLWAVAAECLQQAGHTVDIYGDRELLAEQAMQMGNAQSRHTFFSNNEDRRYIQASGGPVNRPGDFPNILSSLMNKYLDMIELDDDYSYPSVSAVLPGGLNDFKPAPMINKGIVEELDEVSDAEQIKELGIEEEILSYIYMRRFANKFGWTPVLIANDDMNAFAEGMIGLAEAWQVTQNRLVVERFTQNETLLDGSALFSNRADTGSGTNPATNNNTRGSGNPPSDTEWEAMEVLYADIGGVATGRRVRGTLNTIFCPTGAVTHEATRYFGNLNIIGESKQAATTTNIGLFRGKVNIVPESELRVNSALVYYGLRNPTRLNTATVVRGYFNGYGTAGRRERWYDPERKTTWTSLEGRMACAIKNWRYAIRNAGTGA